MDKGKKILAMLVIISLLTVAIIGAVLLQGARDDRIDVDGDDELREAADRNDWDGDGTPEDPFVITMDLDVDGAEPCISLVNTSLHVTIKDCALTHQLTDQGETQGIGILLDQVTNVVLIGNNVSGGRTGLMMVSSSSVTALNNTFDGMDSNFIMSSSESRFENNLFTAVEGNGLQVENCEGNAFSFNSFDGNVLGAGGTRGRVGLVLSYSSNNTFLTDQMSGAGYGSIGITMTDSDYNRIEKAQINGRNGIYMSRANANYLLDNVFGDGVATAIDMVDSDRNIIIGNVMLGNYSVTGFKLTSCEENHFEGNTLGVHSVSGYAIYADSSDENDLFGNNFLYLGSEVRALALAFDVTATNHWNNTTSGNHWSDWTVPDANSDGIVDQPYLLDGPAGALDHFPSTVPFTIL